MNRTKAQNVIAERYVAENLTIYELADILNCHPRTVHKYLVELGIPRRRFGKGSKHKEESKLKTSLSMKQWHATHQHPMRGKNHSKQTRLKMSEAQKGAKGSNWKGGITESVRLFRKSRRYQQWRRVVLERDNHSCQTCSSFASIAHHIKPIKEYPELRFSVENGMALCSKCHNRLHKRRCENN